MNRHKRARELAGLTVWMAEQRLGLVGYACIDQRCPRREPQAREGRCYTCGAPMPSLAHTLDRIERGEETPDDTLERQMAILYDCRLDWMRGEGEDDPRLGEDTEAVLRDLEHPDRKALREVLGSMKHAPIEIDSRIQFGHLTYPVFILED